jgi:hypothetical protein
VVDLINHHKSKFASLSESERRRYISRTFHFVDVLDRSYSVDMYHLLSQHKPQPSL